MKLITSNRFLIFILFVNLAIDSVKLHEIVWAYIWGVLSVLHLLLFIKEKGTV